MTQFADWFARSLLRTSLSLIVAALLVATWVKWLCLRSPDGEQWAWLRVLSQGPPPILQLSTTGGTSSGHARAPCNLALLAPTCVPRLPTTPRA